MEKKFLSFSKLAAFVANVFTKKKVSNKVGGSMLLTAAIHYANRVKCQSDSERTRQTFTYQTQIFLSFIAAENMQNVSVRAFSKLDASHYMNHIVVTRNLSNTSYNNYLTQIRSLFNELKKVEIIEKNYFLDIEMKKEKQTTRRPFTIDEAQITADYLRIYKPLLFVAICLEHYCLIRPAELRRMRLSCIDFSRSVIELDENTTKTGRARTVTIPLSIWAILKPYADVSANWFLFGENFKPHPSKMCGEKTMSNYHRTALKKLKEDGLLTEIDTICLYSWKYLGIKEYAELFGVLAAQNQSGHQDSQMTMRYYRADRVDKNILKHGDAITESLVLPTTPNK